MIRLRRVYDSTDSSDGERFLVERLWPRGVNKTALRVDGWLKNVAPSGALRQWFKHDPKKWGEFQRRYLRPSRRPTNESKSICHRNKYKRSIDRDFAMAKASMRIAIAHSPRLQQ